jgi:hypothetical protein
MWKQVECISCQSMIFSQSEEDAVCEKCDELVNLRITVERYERALVYLSDCNNYMDFDFVLDHIEDVAKKALNNK